MKKVLRIVVDIALLFLLPALMAKMLTGQQIHEWIGTLSFIIFVLHHVLNYRWWGRLAKGKYTASRCLMTAVNLLLAIDILSLIISGIMMSRFVFDWLNISGGMMFAKKLHLSASYWALILMSAHIGIHTGIVAKHIKSVSLKWLSRVLVFGFSLYGAYAFVSQKITDYLFLTTHFVLYDEAKSGMVFMLETAAIIIMFAAVFYYLQKLLIRISRSKTST